MLRTLLYGLAAWSLAFVGCSPYASEGFPPAQQRAAEQYLSDPNSVPFDIEVVEGSKDSITWLATYKAQGKTAKFRIEVGSSKPLSDKESREFEIGSGHGKFIAESGSDATVLLIDLGKALEAKSVPKNAERANSLSFTFVSFGSHQSQAPGGGFNAQPPGNWTPMKIFVGEGEQEGEFFLNLNPVLKKGQFSIKDPDYGDIVLARLATVL